MQDIFRKYLYVYINNIYKHNIFLLNIYMCLHLYIHNKYTLYTHILCKHFFFFAKVNKNMLDAINRLTHIYIYIYIIYIYKYIRSKVNNISFLPLFLQSDWIYYKSADGGRRVYTRVISIWQLANQWIWAAGSRDV